MALTAKQKLFLAAIRNAETGAWGTGSKAEKQVSSKGATSSMQVMRSTALNPGLPGLKGLKPGELTNLKKVKKFGERYALTLLKKYNGDVDRAAQAYHQGFGAVDRGKNPGPITRNYVKKVENYFNKRSANKTNEINKQPRGGDMNKYDKAKIGRLNDQLKAYLTPAGKAKPGAAANVESLRNQIATLKAKSTPIKKPPVKARVSPDPKPPVTSDWQSGQRYKTWKRHGSGSKQQKAGYERALRNIAKAKANKTEPNPVDLRIKKEYRPETKDQMREKRADLVTGVIAATSIVPVMGALKVGQLAYRVGGKLYKTLKSAKAAAGKTSSAAQKTKAAAAKAKAAKAAAAKAAKDKAAKVAAKEAQRKAKAAAKEAQRKAKAEAQRKAKAAAGKESPLLTQMRQGQRRRNQLYSNIGRRRLRNRAIATAGSLGVGVGAGLL